MSAVFNPADEAAVDDWFAMIGEDNDAIDEWREFARKIIAVTGVKRIGLVRQLRLNDVEDARIAAKLKYGYTLALCDYLTPEGCPPYEFTGSKVFSERRLGQCDGITRKKFASQRDRPTLGHELGPDKLNELELPHMLFRRIKHSKSLPMRSKGKNSTEKVADCLFQWAFAKWGNVHVDVAFCETMEQLLNKVWPKLEPWGRKCAHPRPSTAPSRRSGDGTCRACRRTAHSSQRRACRSRPSPG